MSDGEEELNYILTDGDSLQFKYRIIIYSGQAATDDDVESDWEDFVS